MASSAISNKSTSFFDVLRFAAGYWFKYPKMLACILSMTLTASLLETYLPSALASFLGTIQENPDKTAVLTRLAIFLGTYLVHPCASFARAFFRKYIHRQYYFKN
jgi:hypothetical protein